MSDDENQDKGLRLIRSDAQQRVLLETSFAEADHLAGEGRFKQAAEVLETVLAADPSHLEALNHLGWIYAFRVPGRRMDEAVALLRRAVELAPAFTDARFNLACALRNQGRIDEATQQLRFLVEDVFQGPYPEAWYELGYCLEVSGLYDEAVEAYETSYRQETDPEGIKECEESVARCRSKRERQQRGRAPRRRGLRRRER
jgi:tetratricopeptide (TPR) repeat protein